MGGGRGIAVTAVYPTYQCADTTKMALGRGTEAPNARQAVVNRFVARAFIGLPWPRNAAGIRRSGVLMSTNSTPKQRGDRAALCGVAQVARECGHRHAMNQPLCRDVDRERESWNVVVEGCERRGAPGRRAGLHPPPPRGE